MIVVSKSHHTPQYQTSSWDQSQNSGTCIGVFRLRAKVLSSRSYGFPGYKQTRIRVGFGGFKEEPETPLKGHKPAVLTWLHISQKKEQEGEGRRKNYTR